MAGENKPRSSENNGYSTEIVSAVSHVLQEALWATPEKREDYARQLERAAETIRLLPDHKMTIEEVNNFFSNPRAFGKAANNLLDQKDN